MQYERNSWLSRRVWSKELQDHFRRLRLTTPVMVMASVLAVAGCIGKEPAASKASGVASAAAPKAAASAGGADYQRARYDPIHFKPAIDKATNDQCLSCHQEVLKPSVRDTSPAGGKAADAKAWYQQTSTYQGAQDTFHRRHMETTYAKQVMTMKCTTCHTGNNPRDEAPNTSADTQGMSLKLRKMADPEKTCLMCHGKMNWQVMGLPGPWETSKAMFNNNCMTCHASIRTNRHAVNFLSAKAIEEAGKSNGDVCFGCHGGRAWYQKNFPYPRHPWPGATPQVPDWAKDRPTASDVRFLDGVLTAAAGEKK